MISYTDVKNASMTKSKENEAKTSYFAYYVGRPISYLVAIPFLALRVSPNIITLWSIVFSVLGFFLVAFSNDIYTRIFGALSFFAWNILDGVDGNVARYTKTYSRSGDILDTLGGYLTMSFIILSMGVAAQKTCDFLIVDSYELIVVSAISAIFLLIPRLLMHREIALSRVSEAEKLRDKTKYTVSKIIVLNICDPAGFQWVVMIFAIIFNLEYLFTLLYAALNFVIFVYSIKTMCHGKNER